MCVDGIELDDARSLRKQDDGSSRVKEVKRLVLEKGRWLFH